MADISTGKQRGIVPFVDETTGRLPDQYLPQGVIDLRGDLEQAVTDASASATAAKASANSATQSASAAAQSAESASGDASAAKSSETAAASSATAASASKDAAAQSASEASESAEAARTSEINAEASASLAGVVSDRVAALSSRVDQLVASGGDGGDVGTELRDVRVTVDGIVSGSAGEAVRSQIGLLADRFNMTCRPDARNLLVRSFPRSGFVNMDGFQGANSLYVFFVVGVEPGRKYVFGSTARFVTVYAGDVITGKRENVTEFEAVEGDDRAFVTFAAKDAGSWVMCVDGDDPASVLPYGKVSVNDDRIGELEASGCWDPLRGKKWAVCGDSFTAGDFSGSSTPVIESGRYQGHVATYPWLIASRADMEIQDLALGGRTLATPADGSFSNCFSDEIYQTIAEDADIVTLYFGINDSHHRHDASGSDGEDVSGIIELGTIDDADATTFYGAWNVVVPWILENRPDAHLGIIVSNGCETDDYRLATIAIARKWGVPYLDLNGDERTPMMIRSTNPDISSEAKRIALAKWRVGESNQHPNASAHAFESTIIEHFLRTL